MKRLTLIIDTQARSQRFKHRDVKTEMVPFEHVRMLDQALHKQVETISTERNRHRRSRFLQRRRLALARQSGTSSA